MIVVDPAHAGRGLGRVITGEAVARAGRRACYLFATEMGQRLYEKLGFAVKERTYLYESAFTTETELQGHIREGSLEDLRTLDQHAYGQSRELLLSSLWQRRHKCCVVERQGQTVAGALTFWEDEQLVVGPLFCQTAQDCKVLVERTGEGHKAAVCFTQHHHPSLATWLGENGAVCLETEPLMAQADWVPPENWAWVAAIPGFAYG